MKNKLTKSILAMMFVLSIFLSSMTSVLAEDTDVPGGGGDVGESKVGDVPTYDYVNKFPELFADYGIKPFKMSAVADLSDTVFFQPENFKKHLGAICQGYSSLANERHRDDCQYCSFDYNYIYAFGDFGSSEAIKSGYKNQMRYVFTSTPMMYVDGYFVTPDFGDLCSTMIVYETAQYSARPESAKGLVTLNQGKYIRHGTNSIVEHKYLYTNKAVTTVMFPINGKYDKVVDVEKNEIHLEHFDYTQKPENDWLINTTKISSSVDFIDVNIKYVGKENIAMFAVNLSEYSEMFKAVIEKPLYNAKVYSYHPTDKNYTYAFFQKAYKDEDNTVRIPLNAIDKRKISSANVNREIFLNVMTLNGVSKVEFDITDFTQNRNGSEIILKQFTVAKSIKFSLNGNLPYVPPPFDDDTNLSNEPKYDEDGNITTDKPIGQREKPTDFLGWFDYIFGSIGDFFLC